MHLTSNVIKSNWDKLCCSSKFMRKGSSATRKRQVYAIITTMYNSNVRYYHTLEHIESMLIQASNMYNLIEKNIELLYAIFFHDIIYNPMCSNNEKASAVLATELAASLGADSEFCSTVYDLIIATEHNGNCIETNDAKVIADIDLLGFSDPWEIYTARTNLLRKEYAHFSDATFYANRLKFLQQLITRPSIYMKVAIQEKFEEKAWDNIKRDILATKNMSFKLGDMGI